MRRLVSGYFGQFAGFQPDARRFLSYTLISTFAGGIYGLVFNLFVLELGYTREFVGTLESIPAFVTAALAVPLALLWSGAPARRTLLASAALGTAAAFGAVLMPVKPALIFFKFVGGVATALYSTAALPLMAACSGPGEERNRLFSFQFSASMLASFGGSLLGGQLTRLAAALLYGGAETAGAYRVTLLAGAALMALTFIPLSGIGAQAETKGRQRADLAGLDLRKLGWVLAPQVTIGLGAGMVIPYLNIFFKNEFPMDISRLGLIMALMPLSMAFGGMLGPGAVRRLGQVRAMIMFQALSIPFLATVGFSGVLWATVAAAFARTLLMNASWPIYPVFMLGHFEKRHHALVSALYASAWNLLWSLGARLSGTMQMEFGWNMPFLCTIVCYSAATLILSRKFLRAGQPHAAPPVAAAGAPAA